jgi:acetoacetate decarboxylase
MNLTDLLQFGTRGSHRLLDREYLVIVCASDAAAIRAVLPHPLVADGSNSVQLRFTATREPAEAGSSVETTLVVPARLDGVAVDFIAQRYADPAPAPTVDPAWGRVWPRRSGRTRLLFTRETAAAVLEIDGRAVLLAEMGHGKHGALSGATEVCSTRLLRRLLARRQVSLKREAAARGRGAVSQLVGVEIDTLQVQSGWSGLARMHRTAAGTTPIAGFPLRRVVGGFNFVAGVGIGRCEVLFDYRHEARRPIASVLRQVAAGFAPRPAEAA